MLITLEICVFSVMFSACILGNVLLATTLLKNKDLRTHINVLIMNLAVCDMVNVISSVPMRLIILNSGQPFPFGPVACKLAWPISTYSYNASVFSLVTIAIERYIAISSWRAKLTKNKFCFSLIGIHLFALVLVIPYSSTLTYRYSDGHYRCEEDWYRTPAAPKIYTLVLFSLQYLIPSVVMGTLYALAWGKIKSQNQKIIVMSEEFECKSKTEHMFVQELLSANHLLYVRSCRRKTLKSKTAILRYKQTKRMMKMFILMVAVFVVLAFPNQLFWLSLTFTDYYPPHVVEATFILLIHVNSIANCCIYGSFNRAFLKAYKTTLFSAVTCLQGNSNNKEHRLTNTIQSTNFDDHTNKSRRSSSIGNNLELNKLPSFVYYSTPLYHTKTIPFLSNFRSLPRDVFTQDIDLIKEGLLVKERPELLKIFGVHIMKTGKTNI